jgi:3-deoxy-D-manno-octulosonic-acid transferase
LAGNPFYLKIYQGFSALAGLVGWPYFYCHLKSRGRGESFLSRLGLRLPGPPPSGEPRIWLHGVSVGEILAAVPLVQELKALLPQAAFTITTGTETGQAVARANFLPLGAQVCYFPLDLPWAVSRYLNHLRPQLFVALESEIWPNFLTQAHRRGVNLALTNARLSERSFRRYLKYKRYLNDIINIYELINAGSTQDYERFRQLGISPSRLHLTGNLKCDRLLKAWDRDGGAKAGEPGSPLVSSLINLVARQDKPVFLAASTHSGEEEIVLTVYQELRGAYPTLLLILAPRHPERASEVGRLLGQRGLPFHLWTDLKSGRETRCHPVIVIDTIGELFTLYSLADLTFVGGSLVPHGGQNILEPAAWGLAPIYGPHLDNFRWAQAILEEAGAGIMVHDASSLAAAAQNLLHHPETRKALGAKARSALAAHQGAARRQAQLIVEMFRGEGQGA